MSIAVAANARYYEIGFNGFEEFEISNTSASPSLIEEDNTSGNIDFKCTSGSSDVRVNTETFNIVGGYNPSTDYIWIDKSFDDGYPIDKVTLYLKDENNNDYCIEREVDSYNLTAASNTPLNLPGHFKLTFMDLNKKADSHDCPLDLNEIMTGKVVLTSCVTGGNDCSGLAIVDKAHTGERSLKVNAAANINQNSLRLEIGEEYWVSAWVSRDNMPSGSNYTNVSIDVAGNNFTPIGEVIDGWQKVEGIFTYNGGAWSLGFNVGSSPAYFDDIRICPNDGNIQTYVYDPTDYKLRAVMDQNNFATFYQYDEEGNLFLVKKETERGIKTIQETRQYVKTAP